MDARISARDDRHLPSGGPGSTVCLRAFAGEGGSHAWVEVQAFPHGEGHCAHAYDPTNGRRRHMGYTTVAVGRDYGDVSPVSGVYTALYEGQLSCSKQAGITFLEFANGETLGYDFAC